MPPVVIGGFLVLHGLITTMTGFSSVTKPDAPPLSLPSWFSWWPGPFGRSWLFDALGLGTGAVVVGGLIWLVAGVALMAGGLGWPAVDAVRMNASHSPPGAPRRDHPTCAGPPLRCPLGCGRLLCGRAGPLSAEEREQKARETGILTSCHRIRPEPLIR
jgi:hypothetical protein